MERYEEVKQIIDKMLLDNGARRLRGDDFKNFTKHDDQILLDQILYKMQEEGFIEFDLHLGRPAYGSIMKTDLWLS